jgi:hypothetical protein
MIRRLSGSGRKEKDPKAPSIWRTEGEKEREARRLEEAERMRNAEARQSGGGGGMNLSNVVGQREDEMRNAQGGGGRDGWEDGRREQGLHRGQQRRGEHDVYDPQEDERRYEEENRRYEDDDDEEGIDDGYADDGKKKRRSWKPWKL